MYLEAESITELIAFLLTALPLGSICGD